MVSIEELERFNPWWTKGGVPLEWTQEYRRKLYFAIEPYVKRRQILLVYGLRRVGKTTLMMQVISSLLKFTNPRHILYCSFDEETFTIKDVLSNNKAGLLPPRLLGTGLESFDSSCSSHYYPFRCQLREDLEELIRFFR